jgi:PleD family two-component response regulator
MNSTILCTVKTHGLIGAVVLSPDDTPESTLRSADEQLYVSKQNGRNRTTVG